MRTIEAEAKRMRRVRCGRAGGLGWLVLGAVVCMVGLGPATAPTAGALFNDLPAISTSYLGGSQDDAGGGIVFGADNSLFIGGRLVDYNPGGLAPVNLFGGGTGALLRFDETGTSPLGVTRMGDMIHDVAVAPTGSLAVAAGGVGTVMLNPQGDSVMWSDPFSEVRRINVGQDGTVAALGANKQLRLYNPDGTLLGQRNFGDNFVEDIAVDDRTGLVFVTGYNNTWTGQEPAQVNFIRAFDINNVTGAAEWINYDWPGSTLRNEQNPDVADTRGYRISIGGDGMLYFAGEAHGGNTTFAWDPQIVDRRLTSDEWIITDKYSHPWQTRAEAKTVFGRFDPATGELDMLQWLFARLTNNDGNTLRTRGIEADEHGRIFLTGETTAHIRDRLDQSVGGEPVAPYGGGEVFLAVIAPDFSHREHWTVFTATGGTGGLGVGLALGEDRYAMLAGLGGAGETIILPGAYQDARQGGDDMYYVVVPHLMGDANRDGAVLSSDLATVLANLGTGPGKRWIDGDFDADGMVTLRDLSMLLSNYGRDLTGVTGSNALLVPEPSTLALLAPAALLLLGRRRRVA